MAELDASGNQAAESQSREDKLITILASPSQTVWWIDQGSFWFTTEKFTKLHDGECVSGEIAASFLKVWLSSMRGEGSSYSPSSMDAQVHAPNPSRVLIVDRETRYLWDNIRDSLQGTLPKAHSKGQRGWFPQVALSSTYRVRCH